MNQYAGTLIVCVCLGAVAAVAAGCDNASDAAGSAGAAGTVSAAGAGDVGTAGAGTAGGAVVTAGTSSGGGSAAGAPASGGSGAGAGVPLASDATGFVEVDTLGIKGAWYAYGDGAGDDGLPASGNCQKVGMHMAAECSSVTTPMFGSFANMDSKMCTTGHVAKVINLAGMTGCPTMTASCDYSNMFGAGIGLDMNNGGVDGGMGKQPFDAAAAGVVGIAFDIDAVPLAGLRVEFPTDTTANTAAIWKPAKAKNYTSPVVAGHNVILFADVIQPDYIKPAPAVLNAAKLVSIQFHVPTTTTAAADYMFCISNLSAVTK